MSIILEHFKVIFNNKAYNYYLSRIGLFLIDKLGMTNFHYFTLLREDKIKSCAL